MFIALSLFDCEFDRTAREFHYNDIQRERERRDQRHQQTEREKEVSLARGETGEK